MPEFASGLGRTMTPRYWGIRAMTERWVHHSRDRLDRFDPELLLRVQTQGNKPKGLWISNANAEDNWQDWCISERFRLNALKNRHEVTLRQDANILRIANSYELRDFTIKFGGEVPDYLRSGYRIDWPVVTELWDGILISLYLWDCRLSAGCDWYYGWDCASGCIWNARAIADFRFHSLLEVEEIEGAHWRAELPRLLDFGSIDWGAW